jgi:hypothetical protein
MAHAQKPGFIFRWNGRVHLNQLEASVQSTTGSWGVQISSSNAGYTMFRGSVPSTFNWTLPLGHVPEHSKLHGKYHENPKFPRKIYFCSTWIHCHNSETLIISESDQVLYSVTGHSKLPQAALYTEGTECCCVSQLDNLVYETKVLHSIMQGWIVF